MKLTNGQRAAEPPAIGSSHPTTAWHAIAAGETAAAHGSSPAGLSQEQAEERLARFGRNELPAAEQQSALQRFLAQFNNVLIYVLLASAAITAILGHPVDTGIILAVVLINALIGYVQEGKAVQALEAIRRMVSPSASVMRDGRRAKVDAGQLVPGDVLILEAGDRVTADVRLTKARNLRVDEAILTGESVPVEKTIEPAPADAPLGERRSMAYSGTLVTMGQGTGVVVATGPATELGKISSLLSRVDTLETPLIRQMNAFGRQLTFVILALSAVTFAFAVFVRDYPAAEAFMTMVGMAVAAIPEGLPAVLTITLAIGVQRLAAERAIVRRLPAVETLGSVSTICSDKTGTLTRNEMTVTKIVTAASTYDVAGAGYEPRGELSAAGREIEAADDGAITRLAECALLCNDASLRCTGGAWFVEGDPMEGALVALALKTGLEAESHAKTVPRVDEIPFDASHRYMATLHRTHERTAFAYVKGAPERVLDMCELQLQSAGEAPFDRGYWESAIADLASSGHRVLALAFKPFPPDTATLTFGDFDTGLILLGVVGLMDPPRPEAIAAVALCRQAGIAVKMITGDHALTATAIAAKLGLEKPEQVATGQQLDQMDDARLRRLITETNVFARTSPEHKLRLVELMQAEGAVIAMTGDGVNDSPALKRADVGIAMGQRGTEAAKEAAEVVLADDNFATIVAAVREGRTIYDNLTKVIGWTLPTNGGETIVIIAAILFGLTLPVTPAQILWINMVTAVGLGLVLAFEPPEPDVMQRPPRAADAPMLSAFVIWRILLVSLLFAAGAFGMFAWAKARGLSLEEARTIVVNTIVVMEIFYLFSVRFLHGGSLTLRGIMGTPAVIIGVGAIVVLQFALTYFPPLQALFQTRNIGLLDGLSIVGVGFALLLILEAEKQTRRHFLP